MDRHCYHAQPYRRAFIVGIVLNVGFIVIEVILGLSADSLALLADAAVSFGVVLAGSASS